MSWWYDWCLNSSAIQEPQDLISILVVGQGPTLVCAGSNTAHNPEYLWSWWSFCLTSCPSPNLHWFKNWVKVRSKIELFFMFNSLQSLLSFSHWFWKHDSGEIMISPEVWKWVWTLTISQPQWEVLHMVFDHTECMVALLLAGKLTCCIFSWQICQALLSQTSWRFTVERFAAAPPTQFTVWSTRYCL